MKRAIAVFTVLFILGSISTSFILIGEGRRQAVVLYNKGFVAGERVGFDNGFIACHNNLGMWWRDSAVRFNEFIKKYGSIHNTPWNELTIEEKAIIAMYGGSGSKLENNEIQEFKERYAK